MFEDSLRPFRAVFPLKFGHAWVESLGPYKTLGSRKRLNRALLPYLPLIVERAQNEAIEDGNQRGTRE